MAFESFPSRDLTRSESGHGAAAVGDRALLDRVRANDHAAMVVLFDRYGGMIYSTALRILGDYGQAEDVMQELLFRLWRNPADFIQERGSLGAWLMVVARNRSIDILRRRKPVDSPDDVVLVANTDLASETERDVLMEKVRVVVRNLPPEQQKSLELAFFEGLTHLEIAEKTGAPLGTVKTRIRSALTSLRKALAA